MPERLPEVPTSDESLREDPDKKPKNRITMQSLFGAGSKEKSESTAKPESKDSSKSKSADRPKPKPEPGREQHEHEQADALLKDWPEKNEDQVKNEFLSGAENFLKTVDNIEASCKFNGIEEKYNFKCNTLYLVNGQPSPLKDVKEGIKEGKISTGQVSFDFKMEKVNGLPSGGMRLSVPVSDFINGGPEKVQATLSKMVQNIYGAARQGSEASKSADHSKMLTAQASEDAFKANQQLADRVKAAASGKDSNIVEFNNPESRETLLVIEIPKKGTQISLSLSGGAIARASRNGKPLPGTPSEVLNAVKDS